VRHPVSRLIVADPGLIDAGGHHLSYSMAVAEAAAAIGIEATILAHRSFATATQIANPTGSAVTMRPTFVAHYQSGGQQSTLRAVLYTAAARLPGRLAPLVAQPLRTARRMVQRHFAAPDSLGAELASALHVLRGTRGDLVLLHSVSAANLLGLTQALAPNAVGALAIVLRRTPEEMDLADAAPIPVKAVLGRLRQHFDGRLALFADTEPLARRFEGLTGTAVATLPLPIVAPPMRQDVTMDRPHLVFAGGARREKGYGLLPGLAKRLRGRVRFTIQSGQIGAGTDPNVQQAHRALVRMAGADMVILERALEPPEYMQVLASADLMLLPYDAEAYGPRSSGILAEARGLGIPAIVPNCTWMATAAGPCSAVIFDGPDDFIPAVERTLQILPEVTKALRELAPAWRQDNSPERVIRALLRECEPDRAVQIARGNLVPACNTFV